MNIEQPVSSHTRLSTLDVRTRLIGIVLFSAVTASLQTRFALGAALVFSLALAAAARTPWKYLYQRLIIVNLFVAFLWLFLPWSIPGEEMFRLGRLQVSRQGVEYTLMLTVRSNALVLALIAFMSSASIASITRAMSLLHMPDKIAYLFFFTYRYIGEISNEHARLLNAMQVRCFLPRTSLHTYRSYACLVGMLLVKSYERAQRVRMAMLLRGFNGRFPCLDTGRISRIDVLSLSVLCLFLAGVLYADRP
jgi:cobalt/nickel transport system permease protein